MPATIALSGHRRIGKDRENLRPRWIARSSRAMTDRARSSVSSRPPPAIAYKRFFCLFGVGARASTLEAVGAANTVMGGRAQRAVRGCLFICAAIAWGDAGAEESKCEDRIARSDRFSFASPDFKPAALTFSLHCEGKSCKMQLTFDRTVLEKSEIRYGQRYRICSETSYRDEQYKPPSCSGRYGAFSFAVSEIEDGKVSRLLGAAVLDWIDFGQQKAADCLTPITDDTPEVEGNNILIPTQSIIVEPFRITTYERP
jgi:hypothetical protein